MNGPDLAVQRRNWPSQRPPCTRRTGTIFFFLLDTHRGEETSRERGGDGFLTYGRQNSMAWTDSKRGGLGEGEGGSILEGGVGGERKMVARSWRCFGRWGRRRRCPARFAASQIDSLDEDAEDDEAVTMAAFNLLGEAPIAGDARRYPWIGFGLEGEKQKERERSEERRVGKECLL